MILDYNNVKYYLGKTLFSLIICKGLSLPIQADAIKVALLKNMEIYGWMLILLLQMENFWKN